MSIQTGKICSSLKVGLIFSVVSLRPSRTINYIVPDTEEKLIMITPPTFHYKQTNKPTCNLKRLPEIEHTVISIEAAQGGLPYF